MKRRSFLTALGAALLGARATSAKTMAGVGTPSGVLPDGVTPFEKEWMDLLPNTRVEWTVLKGKDE